MSEPEALGSRPVENGSGRNELGAVHVDGIRQEDLGAWMVAHGALRKVCSAPLACAAHDCPVPCEACEAEGESDIICVACKHVFSGTLPELTDRACSSADEFARTGHIAFYAEARALWMQREEGRRLVRERKKSAREEERKKRAEARRHREEDEDHRHESDVTAAARRSAESRKREEEERRAAPAERSTSSGKGGSLATWLLVLIFGTAGYFYVTSGIKKHPLPDVVPKKASESEVIGPQSDRQASRSDTLAMDADGGEGTPGENAETTSMATQQSPAAVPDSVPVTGAWLGVRISSLDDAAAQKFGLPGSMGALVEELISGGPAERAGLQVGDVVLGINGEFVDAVPDILRELSQLQPRDWVELRVLRQREEVKINVQLEQQPGNASDAQPSFDCNDARTPSEKYICSDPAVAAADRLLAETYQKALKANWQREDEIRREQNSWLNVVRDRCEDRACFLGVYRVRQRILVRYLEVD